jgi:prevent-host-death family protein
MTEHVVMATEFKAHCLALLDEVALTKVPVVVTKHGRPVARVVAIDEPERRLPTLGSVTLLDSDDEVFFSTGERWNADHG